MKHTKIISLFSAVVIMFSSLSVSAVVFDEAESAEFQKFFALEIIPEEIADYSAEQVLTRADFTHMLMKAMGLDDIGNTENIYSDISSDNPAKDSINYAHGLGLLDWVDGTRFEPYSAMEFSPAVDMILNSLGCGELADGEEKERLKASMSQKVTKNVGGNKGYLTFAGAVQLLDNSLEIPLVVRNLNGYDEFVISGSGGTDEHTILSYYLGIDHVDVNITEINMKKRSVTYYDEDGKRYICRASEYINLDAIVTGDNRIYADSRSRILLFIDETDGVDVYADFITAVNDDYTQGMEYRGDAVKTVYLANEDKEYKIDKDAKIYYNDAPADFLAVPFAGSFAKIAVKNGKIIKLDVYSLTEGGILKIVNDDELIYTLGERNEFLLKGFENASELYIYIDGVYTGRIRDLKADMLFDYYKSDDGDKYIIAASSRKVVQKLEAVSDKLLYIGGKSYEYVSDEIYGYGETERKYKRNFDFSDFTDKYIEAYIGDDRYVKYIKLSDDSDTSAFYGVILAVDEGSPLSSDGLLKIYSITGKQGEAVYEISKKMKNSPVSFQYASSVAGEDTARNFFKFHRNSKNKIVKIEPVEYFGNTLEKTTKFSDSDWGYIGAIPVARSTIFALYKDDYGKLKVTLLSLSGHLRDSTVLGIASDPVIVTTDYDIRENPLPRFTMLTGNVSCIYNATNESRLVTDVRRTNEDKYKLVLSHTTLGNQTVTVSEKFVKSHNIGEGSYIWYSTAYTGSEPIAVTQSNGADKIYDLSLPASEWKTDTFSRTARTGFFETDGIIFFGDNSVQFTIDGEPTDVYFMMDSNIQVYELNEGGKGGRFLSPPNSKSKLAGIEEGDKVWFGLQDWPGTRSVALIVYEKQ